MQTIILIRHGYPISWDQQLKTRGIPAHLRQDPALAELGTKQATLSAAQIKAAGGAAVIITSPFRRCLETADRIAAACKAEIVPDWKIGEVLLSTVLGTPFSPTGGMDPEWVERRAKAGKPSHPESDRTIQERVAKMVNELKALKPFAQRVVVVSHDIILKELAKVMTGRAMNLDWHPCAMTVLKREKPVDRTWLLSGGFADITHLGADDRAEPVHEIVVKYHPDDSRA